MLVDFGEPWTATTAQGTPLAPEMPRPFDAAYLERLLAGDLETEKHFAAYVAALILAGRRRGPRSRGVIEDVRRDAFQRVVSVLRAPDGIRALASLRAIVSSATSA